MTTLFINSYKDTYCFVSIPGDKCVDINICRFRDDINKFYLQFDSEIFKGMQNYRQVDLPTGSWYISFIGEPDKISEEVAAGIVESRRVKESFDDNISIVFIDYLNNQPPHKYFKSAIESMTTLIQSLRLKDKIIILKKI